MIAKNNPQLEEAAKTIYQMSDDELIRERCRAREEHYRILAGFQNAAKEAQDKLAVKETELADAQAALQEQAETIVAKDQQLAEQTARIAELEALLAAKHSD